MARGAGFGDDSARKAGATSRGFGGGKGRQPSEAGKSVPSGRARSDRSGSSTLSGPAPSVEATIAQNIESVRAESPSLHDAMQLRQRLVRWELEVGRLGVLEQAALPAAAYREMKQAAAQLEKLQSSTGITNHDIGAAFHRATWDATAEARNQRHSSQDLPAEAIQKMRAIARAGLGDARGRRALDVGCGTGILLKFLKDEGVRPSDMTGLDLSPKMLAVAARNLPGAAFITGDFLRLKAEEILRGGSGGFGAVFFNEVLHNFEDPAAVLERAKTLLAPRGRIIVSHPKGSASVARQRQHNPILAPCEMPSAAALRKLCAERMPDLSVVLPAAAQTAPTAAAAGNDAVLTEREEERLLRSSYLVVLEAAEAA